MRGRQEIRKKKTTESKLEESEGGTDIVLCKPVRVSHSRNAHRLMWQLHAGLLLSQIAASCKVYNFNCMYDSNKFSHG
jgi:hypothetical protein